MLNLKEYKNMFKETVDKLFINCIVEQKEKDWETKSEYKSYKVQLNQNLKELLGDNDKYLEISDVINSTQFTSAIQEVFFEEINNKEYLSDAWSGYRTTYKCFVELEENSESVLKIITDKLEELKAKYLENLINTYEQYVRTYKIKEEYIIFADKIKEVGFDVCDYQRRGEVRVPCTFSKEFDSLTLFVRKNVNNYRIYLKCNIGGRYGMTVEEFDNSYQILKKEETSIKNALIGEEII